MLHVVLYTILSLELIKTKTYYLNAAHNLLLLNELYSVYLVNILLKCCLHWKALKIEWTRCSRKKNDGQLNFTFEGAHWCDAVEWCVHLQKMLLHQTTYTKRTIFSFDYKSNTSCTYTKRYMSICQHKSTTI